MSKSFHFRKEMVKGEMKKIYKIMYGQKRVDKGCVIRHPWKDCPHSGPSQGAPK